MNHRAALTACCGIVAAGLWVRLVALDDIPFWFDEAFSLRMSEFSFVGLVQRCTNDTHPPLSFLVMKIWMAMFGSSEWAARLLSVAWSLTAVAAVFGFTYEAIAHDDCVETSKRRPLLAATIAACCIAFSPLQISWAQQVRMYAPAACLCVVGTWLLWRALVKPDRTRRWVAFTIVETLAVYCHVTLFLVATAHVVAIAAIVIQQYSNKAVAKSVFLRGVASFMVITAAAIPWLTVIRSQHAAVTEAFWTKPFDLDLLGDALIQCFGVPKRPVGDPDMGLWLAQAIMVLILLVAIRRQKFDLLIAITASLPFIMLVAASIVGRNIVHPRYFIASQSIVFIALGTLIARIPIAGGRVVCGSCLIAGSAWLAWDYHELREEHSGKFALRELALVWEEHAEPSELLVFRDPTVYTTARFYHETQSRLRLRGKLDDYPFYLGTAILSPDEFVNIAPKMWKPKRLWICDTTWQDPNSPAKELGSEWQLVSEKKARDYSSTYVLKLYEAKSTPVPANTGIIGIKDNPARSEN